VGDGCAPRNEWPHSERHGAGGKHPDARPVWACLHSIRVHRWNYHADKREFTIDDFVTRGSVAAFEVYPRVNLVPPEFNGGITGCGAIAVWSKFGTEKINVLPTKSDRKRR